MGKSLRWKWTVRPTLSASRISRPALRCSSIASCATLAGGSRACPTGSGIGARSCTGCQRTLVLVVRRGVCNCYVFKTHTNVQPYEYWYLHLDPYIYIIYPLTILASACIPSIDISSICMESIIVSFTYVPKTNTNEAQSKLNLLNPSECGYRCRGAQAAGNNAATPNRGSRRIAGTAGRGAGDAHGGGALLQRSAGKP